jgi:hypothetical protein
MCGAVSAALIKKNGAEKKRQTLRDDRSAPLKNAVFFSAAALKARPARQQGAAQQASR